MIIIAFAVISVALLSVGYMLIAVRVYCREARELDEKLLKAESLEEISK